jgi:plasmid stability protein
VGVSELRVEIPDDVARGLATEAAQRGTSAEEIAAEVLTRHVPSASSRPMPRFVGKGHSGRHDLSVRIDEILSADLGL